MIAVCFVMVVMMLSNGHSNEEGGEHREYVGLDEGNQQFQEVDEQRKCDAHRRHAVARTGAEDVGEREDEADEAQDDQVTRRHVGKQTDGERDGLGQDAQDFDRHQDRLDERRNSGGPENASSSPSYRPAGSG